MPGPTASMISHSLFKESSPIYRGNRLKSIRQTDEEEKRNHDSTLNELMGRSYNPSDGWSPAEISGLVKNVHRLFQIKGPTLNSFGGIIWNGLTLGRINSIV